MMPMCSNYLKSWPRWRLAQQRMIPAITASSTGQFHNTIYSCCGNGTLLGIINDLIAKSSQSQSIFYRSPKRMQVSTLQHRQIAEAIRSKDFEQAQLLMRKHKEEGFQLTVELLENSG